MAKERAFASEADLVAAFCSTLDPSKWATNPAHAPQWTAHAPQWTVYHETAGWDLLLAHPNGVQVGIEAKLSLNAKVLEQALPGRWADACGPDYRAVLVPWDGLQNHLEILAKHLGIVVLTVRSYKGWNRTVQHSVRPLLPDERSNRSLGDWPNWCPAKRCALPDYVPDVSGGKAAPVALTPWKIKAIKLLILLERRGFVTRKDMAALQISPSRWTDHWHGFLTAGGNGGYVRCDRTPDLKAQHPTNWDQIEADFAKWSAGLFPPADAESVPA